MTNSVYGIALSGLNVARAGLSTTSNNIANVNTAGYNRQETVVNSRESNFVGGAYIGQGVDIETVRRVYSDFISGQQKDAATDAAFYEAKFQQVSRLDGVIADEASGLASAISDFFASAQTLSTVPGDLSARQNFLSAAESLAARFNSVNGVMDNIRDATNLKVNDTVTKINDISAQIAELNTRIVAVSNQTFNNSAPNDLLDKRDQLILNLSEQVQVTTVNLNDGGVNLFLANGQPLVVKDTSFNVLVQEDPTDRQNLLVGTNIVKNGVSNLVAFEPGTLGGGALSGFLEFRETELAEYQNSLGLMAAQIATTVNDLQAQGVDLRNLDAGNLTTAGNPIFGFIGSSDNTDITANLVSISRVTSNSTNTGTGGITLQNADFSRMKGQDFDIRISDAGVPQYRVKGSGADYVNLPATTATDIAAGFTGAYKIPDSDAAGSPLVSFDITGATQPKDGFTIYPTRDAAKNLQVVMSDPSEVATAVRQGQPDNLDPANVSLKARAPEQGDNDNALQFANLQNTRVLLQGGGSRGVSVGDAFNQLVSKIGNKTREFEIATESRQAVLEQTSQVRDAYSGVNMDEEAAALIKYQQAYQASGRVISLSKELFELVLGIFR